MAQMYKVFNDNIPLILHSNIFYLGDEDNFLYLKFDFHEEWDYFINNVWRNDGVDGLSVFAENIDEAWTDFKSCFRIVQAAGGVVLNEHGEVLIIERNGFHDLPKGHIEENELAKEAALREVAEECGLKDHTIKSSNPKVSYHIYLLKGEWILKKTFWFAMTASVNEPLIPQTKEGITRVKWMDRHSIRKNRDRFYSSLLDLLV
jgi:ADP-ribose pyrophosphatase YjhB (NUDIX family)